MRAGGARPGDHSDGGEGPTRVGRTVEAGEWREGAVEGPSDGRLARTMSNGREVGLRERVTGSAGCRSRLGATDDAPARSRGPLAVGATPL